jgi:hypothetical protein
VNERIKQLAEQAAITTNLETDYFEKDINKWVDYYSEKFAELIVQECIDLARFCECIDGSRDPDDYTKGCHDAIHITIERMASEFGVRL